MARTTHVYTIDHVAKLIGENLKLLRKSPATRTISTMAR